MASPTAGCQRQSHATADAAFADGAAASCRCARNVGLFIVRVRSSPAERSVIVQQTLASVGASMTDDNRIRPPFGAVRAGYGSAAGPRYQPRSLVTPRRRGIGAKRAIDAAIGRQRQEGDTLRHRRRRRRGRRLARLLWRREFALRYFPRPVRRRSRRAAAGEAVRPARHPDELVHSRTLDRDVSRRSARWWSMPDMRSACTATRTRTRSP